MLKKPILFLDASTDYGEGVIIDYRHLPSHLVPVDSMTAENLVEYLYLQNEWTLITKRMRIRGSEIDLATFNKSLNLAHIVEVKLRSTNSPVQLQTIESLLTANKLSALRRGALAIQSRFTSKELNPNWCAVLVLVTTNKQKQPFCRLNWWPIPICE